MIKTIPIPEQPIENRGDWNQVETVLNIKLPKDYKEYINTYGTGAISEFLWVFNPFSENENLNLIKQITKQIQAFGYTKKDFPEDVPYPLFPEKNGLLPWGLTDNGDVLLWLTDPSNEWKVVLNGSRSPDFEEYDMLMTEFVGKYVTGSLSSDYLAFEEGFQLFKQPNN